MTAQPRIALLIPAYNAADTIAATLDSVHAQTARSRLSAVYVADDGSTDQTVHVTQHAWRSELPLVVFENDPNVGERQNVNRAVARFGHEVDWFCILHADDLVKPEWLARVLDVIDGSSDALASVCCSWDNLWPDGKLVRGEDQAARSVEHIAGSLARVRDTLLIGCWWHISGCAIRVRAFEQVGPFDRALPQLGDWDWLLRCLADGCEVAYIPRTLVVYRQSPGSVGSVSLRTDRDIREGLALIRRYRCYLSRQDVVRVHVARLGFALRRAARGASQRRWRRAGSAIGAAGQVVASGAALALDRATEHRAPIVRQQVPIADGSPK